MAFNETGVPICLLIGLGRVASNIALDVAIVSPNDAKKQNYMREVESQEMLDSERESPAYALDSQTFRRLKIKMALSSVPNPPPPPPAYRYYLGDFRNNRTLKGEFVFPKPSRRAKFLEEYTKPANNGLSEVHAGWCR